MSATTKPLGGTGLFQWNGGGWWGAALGGTAWMATLAVQLTIAGQPLLALWPLVWFLLANGMALTLWMRRDRTRPFPALMLLLGMLSMLMPVVWFGVTLVATPETLRWLNWPASQLPVSGALLIAPSLMVFFWVLETHRRRVRTLDTTRQPEKSQMHLP